MAFGLTATVMCRWLKFSRHVLLHALQDHPLAKVREPFENETEECMEAMGVKCPMLLQERVWGAADGLKLRLQTAGTHLVQNQCHNGWTGGTHVNSVFLFAPDGMIRCCTLNAPGSMRDSTLTDCGVCEKMSNTHKKCNAKVVVDSAFNMSGSPCLTKSAQIDPIETAAGLSSNREATSLRQLSEWGVRMIQAQFPRMKEPIAHEEMGERRLLQHLMVLLCDFQTSMVSINQMLNACMSQEHGFFSFERSISNHATVDLFQKTL